MRDRLGAPAALPSGKNADSHRIGEQTIHVLRLTQLYNILLLFCYLLQVSVSTDHHHANIYRKLKTAGACSTKSSILWDPNYSH